MSRRVWIPLTLMSKYEEKLNRDEDVPSTTNVQRKPLTSPATQDLARPHVRTLAL
jgi:hypothetical protein